MGNNGITNIAAFMMIDSLNKKGYNAYAISVPSPNDLMIVFRLAVPVFIMMISKVAFFSLIVYFVTSMGTLTLAAHQMHKVLIPYFFVLPVTPCILSLEGTLLAGRDLKFISVSTSGCFSMGAVLLLLVSSRGYGLPGCWFALVGFQWARFFLSLQRLLSPDGILFSEDLSQHELKEPKAA